MKDIAIFGAGGFGCEVACLIKRINQVGGEWNFIGFFDDGVAKDTPVSHYGRVLGNMSVLNAWNEKLSLAICIGDSKSLKFVRERINNRNILFPNIIAPNFQIADMETFSIGEGNIIQDGCFVSCNVAIGNYNVLNGSVVIGHNGRIGDYNAIMSNVFISGEVTIENENLVGVGSIILQQIKIGNNVRIGAGAVLMTKPRDGGTYLGNPAKLFNY